MGLKSLKKHIAKKLTRSYSYQSIKSFVKQLKELQHLFWWVPPHSAQNLQKVEKGCFPVLTKAKGNDKTKRFNVPISYLSHPQFIKLLDAAEQEFEFSQKGILVIPCDAISILADLPLRAK
ncbi:hypothetical protein ACFE04_003550 [Oxalis oulophora]